MMMMMTTTTTMLIIIIIIIFTSILVFAARHKLFMTAVQVSDNWLMILGHYRLICFLSNKLYESFSRVVAV